MQAPTTRARIFVSHGLSDWQWFKDNFGAYPDEKFKSKYTFFSRNLKIALGRQLDKLPQEIRDARASLVILSNEYLRDPWLNIEIGQLLALDQTTREREQRPFVVLAERERIDLSASSLDSTVDEAEIILLDPANPSCLDALCSRIDTILGRFKKSIFISHASKDADFALALLNLIKTSIPDLQQYQIICTSLEGHTLRPGVRVEERLKVGVHDAELFIGLITKNSIDSTYVLFELGARWGADRPLLPLVAGISLKDESPLNSLHAVDCTQTGQVTDFIVEISKITGTKKQDTESAYSRELTKFVQMACNL